MHPLLLLICSVSLPTLTEVLYLIVISSPPSCCEPLTGPCLGLLESLVHLRIFPPEHPPWCIVHRRCLIRAYQRCDGKGSWQGPPLLSQFLYCSLAPRGFQPAQGLPTPQSKRSPGSLPLPARVKDYLTCVPSQRHMTFHLVNSFLHLVHWLMCYLAVKIGSWSLKASRLWKALKGGSTFSSPYCPIFTLPFLFPLFHLPSFPSFLSSFFFGGVGERENFK